MSDDYGGTIIALSKRIDEQKESKNQALVTKINNGMGLLSSEVIPDEVKVEVYKAIQPAINAVFGIDSPVVSEWDDKYTAGAKRFQKIGKLEGYDPNLKRALQLGALAETSPITAESFAAIPSEDEQKKQAANEHYSNVIRIAEIVRAGESGKATDKDAEDFSMIKNSANGGEAVSDAVNLVNGEKVVRHAAETGDTSELDQLKQNDPKAYLEAMKVVNEERKTRNEMPISEETKEISRGRGKLYIKLQEASAIARDAQTNMDVAEELISKTRTGKYASYKTQLFQLLGSFRIPINEKWDANQALEAFSNTLAIQARRAGSHEGQILVGSVSDKDMKLLKESVVGLDKSERSNIILTSIARLKASRDAKIAEMATDYMEKYKTLNGFEKVVAEYAKRNSLFRNFDFNEAYASFRLNGNTRGYFDLVDKRNDAEMEGVNQRPKAGAPSGNSNPTNATNPTNPTNTINPTNPTMTSSQLLEKTMSDMGLNREDAINFLRGNRNAYNVIR